MYKFTGVLSLLIFLITISGCDYFEDALDIFYNPTVNSKPQNILRLHGEISPFLNLTITSKYKTNNNRCKKTINWLEGVKSNRFYTFNHPVIINNGMFEVFVDFNKIKSGYCQWELFSIDYSITKNNKTRQDHMFPARLVQFYNDRAENQGIQIQCDFLRKSNNIHSRFLPCRHTKKSNRQVNFKQKQLHVDFIDKYRL